MRLVKPTVFCCLLVVIEVCCIELLPLESAYAAYAGQFVPWCFKVYYETRFSYHCGGYGALF